MTVPNKDSLATYGGVQGDYIVPIVDPTTDMAASDHNAMAASCAMMTRMTQLASVSFGWPTATAVAPRSFEAIWKGSTTTVPTVARTGVGTYTVTWPTTVLDELGVSHTLSLGRGHASAYPAAVPRWSTATVWAASLVTTLGAVVVPTVSNGRQFTCTVAGTRGASEPVWDTWIGNPTTDGGVTWVAAAGPSPAATTAAVDDLVLATSPTTARLFRCTVAGTRGASEPVWNTTLTNTTADGSVTWRCEEIYPRAAQVNYTATSANSGTVRTFAVPGGALADMFGVNRAVDVSGA